MRVLVLILICVCLSCNDTVMETEVLDVPGAPPMPMNCPPMIYKEKTRMAFVKHGYYTMGGAVETDWHRTPEWRVLVESFYIDRWEVTVGEFLKFMQMTGYTPLPESMIGDVFDPMDYYEGPLAHYDNLNYLSYPVQVRWRDAVAYATWVGKRLPTEVEWEKAARGGIEGATFSWGDRQPTLARPEDMHHSINRKTYMANEAAIALGGGGAHPTHGHWLPGFVGPIPLINQFQYKPVGSYLPNGYGLFDMIGNVNEWCSDDWNENAYLLMMNGIIPEDISGDGKKVVRGGGLLHSSFIVGFTDTIQTMSIDKRNQYLRYTIHIAERQGSNGSAGFRCVLDTD